ncbi:MAG TPA: universal stress protein [Mycobacteriales bacterium]|nr:universal stress protein [Mycobacteriales bacterium]
MTTETQARVIVGVDGSCGSLHALRVAVAEARRRGHPLVVVHAVRPGMDPGGWPTAERTGHRVIADSLNEALGGQPADLRVSRTVVELAPGPALVHLVRGPDDLLVLGSRAICGLGRLRWSGADTYCVRHAPCPVLVVPPPTLLRLARTSRRERRDWQRGIEQLTSGSAGR